MSTDRKLFSLCEEIQSELGCDFVGVTFQNQSSPDFSWLFVSGNLNNKYKKIKIRIGIGLIGKALSRGSTIVVNNLPNELTRNRTDYPIMLAEKLVSAVAVPLFLHGLPKGVFMIGKRTFHEFVEEEIMKVKNIAGKIEVLL